MTLLTETYRRIYLPYCLKRLPDGRHVVLNRKYKPLGIHSDDWIEYEPYAVKFKRLTVKQAGKLSIHGKEEVELIYLYDDGSVPSDNTPHMTRYLAKIALLAKLEFTLDRQKT